MGNIIEIKQKQKEVLERIRKRNISLVTKEISGSTFESLALNFRCSTTGRDFIVLLKREQKDKLYEVVKIVTDDTPSHSNSLLFTPTAINIEINKIDDSDIKCPYCNGGKWIFIKCGCGKLSCAGGVKEYKGEYLHVCPWCKTEGYIKGHVKEVSGEIIDEIKLREKNKKELNDGKGYAALLEK